MDLSLLACLYVFTWNFSFYCEALKLSSLLLSKNESMCITSRPISSQVCVIRCQPIMVSHGDQNSSTFSENIFVQGNKRMCKEVLQLVGVSRRTELSLTQKAFRRLTLSGFVEISISNSCINRFESGFFQYILHNTSHRLVVLAITENSCLRFLPSKAFNGFTQMKTLDLQANEIELIDTECFHNLRSLQSLLLSHNKLTTINNQIFREGLSSLRYLDLSYNYINNIGLYSFSSLTSLESLHLNGNRLQILQAGVFATLSLRTLNLSSNFLTTFEASIVAGMTRESLRSLYLSHNELTTMDEDVVDFKNSNPEYVEIHLDHNQWHCDCALAWMKRRIEFILTNTIRCHSPLKLQNKTLNSLASGALCPSSPDSDYNEILYLKPDNWRVGTSSTNSTVSYKYWLLGILLTFISLVILSGIYLLRSYAGGLWRYATTTTSENDSGGLLSSKRSWFVYPISLACGSHMRIFCPCLCRAVRNKMTVASYDEVKRPQTVYRSSDGTLVTSEDGELLETLFHVENENENTSDRIPLQQNSSIAI